MRELAMKHYVDREVSGREDLTPDLVHQLVPQWNRCQFKVEVQTEGITNKLLKLTRISGNKAQDDAELSDILVRIYGHGTATLIDRQAELLTLLSLEKLLMAPPLLSRFQNGFCYGYMRGRVLQASDLSDMWREIARAVAKWHREVNVPMLPVTHQNSADSLHLFSLDDSTLQETDVAAAGSQESQLWAVFD